MTLNIDRLLKKKKWKGEEVGKAVILGFVNDYENRAKQSYIPLFTQEDLTKMLDGITDPREGRIYNDYINLYNGIVSEYNQSEAYNQQVQNGFYRVLTHVNEVRRAEDVKGVIESFPLIMTQKQYSKTREKAIARKEAFEVTYQDLIFDALSFYLGEGKGRKPRAPKPIKEALGALKKEPFTNPVILGLINKTWGLGYYLFPDGKRSDQMTKEGYAEELNKYEPFRQINIDLEGDPEELSERRLEKILDNYKHNYNGTEEEDLLKWCYYEDPPEGLTKWDVLAGDYDMREVYTGASDEHRTVEFINEFAKDYPLLLEALRTDIATKKGLESTINLKPEEYFNGLATWGELAKNKVYSYPSLVEIDGYAITEVIQSNDEKEEHSNRTRSAFHGVAVLQEETLTMSNNIDDNGEYKNPYIDLFKHFNGLETYGKDPYYKKTITDAIDISLVPGLKSIEAYNVLIDLIAKEYNLKELLTIKKDMEPLKKQIEGLNGLILALYNHLKGTEEEIKNNRTTIKEIFKLIDLDKIKPAKDAIESAREEIRDPENYKSGDLQRIVRGLMASAGGNDNE